LLGHDHYDTKEKAIAGRGLVLEEEEEEEEEEAGGEGNSRME